MPVTCSRHTYVGHLQCPECKKESQSEVGLLRARVLKAQATLELNRDNITPKAFRAIADALKG